MLRTNYTTDKDLPRTIGYHLLADSIGFLRICTNRTCANNSDLQLNFAIGSTWASPCSFLWRALCQLKPPSQACGLNAVRSAGKSHFFSLD